MWAVYASAAVMALIYTMNIPIRCAFTVSLGERRTVKLGVGIFGARYIIERELTIPRMNLRPNAEWNPGLFRGGRRALKYLLVRLRAEGMRFSAEVGTGDAARTALICGAAQGAADVARVQAHIVPNFAGRSFRLSGGGIIHVRLGHSIGAGLLLAFELVNGKVRQRWTGIQSKGSCQPRWRISGTWWT